MVPLHDTEDFVPPGSAQGAAAQKESRSQAATINATRPADRQPLADITPVPTSEAKCVLTPSNLLIAKVLTILPIPAGLLGAGGLIVVGCFLYDSGPGAVAPLVMAGLVWGAVCEVTRLWFRNFLASHFLHAVAKTHFRRRANPVVRFGDAETEFVEIIPRGSWQGAASEIGLWRIDRDKRQFLFEGDSKRYRIPFDAVVSCDVDDIHLAEQHGGLDFAVVLLIESADGPRQISLMLRHLDFAPRRVRERHRVAESHCQQIREALG